MWETIARYEGKEMLNMTGTWLALPLAALKSNYGRLYSKTCGGTVGGRRPAPSLDMLVCVPVEDVKAEETWTLWKDSFSSLVLMFSVFILGSHAIRSEGERLLERRWRFYLASGFGFMFAGHGLLGGLAMLAIVLANFGLARATARLPLGVAQGVAWAFALLSMEAVFRLLGDHAHRVGGSDEEQGVKYWSLLEAMVCGEDALLSPESSGTSCRLHQPFVLKGLCPWFLYRFVALKLVSFSLDFAWTVRAVPSRVRALEDKPELVQRTERNLPLEKYGLQQYLCYVFYVPTYATGPILSYNAFVSQVEEEQKSYSRKDLLFFGLRLILFIVLIEAFSVVWWYSQKLHPMSCMPGGLYEQCIFDDLSVWELFLATHVRLHFTWLQLLIIWRFGRMVALLDGIDTPENMLGCVSFNYTFEAFWRIWHSSMNRFMLRYLYNPLGGKARSWLAVPLVFTFVAYWHENTGFMTRPWWYFWGLMNAVGVTAEKALADSLGKSLARAASSGRWQGKCLQLLARGCGPLALIAVNLPALLFASTPHFYASLFWRGWPSLLLVASLVVVYGCNAELVEALREGKGPAPPAARDLAGPASGARVAPPLPPPPASPRPSEVAVAGEVEAGLSPRQRRCSDVALPRRSFEAERQDSLLVELEDISLSSTASWRSAASSSHHASGAGG